MAALTISDWQLHLNMSRWERIFGLHSDIVVPTAQIVSVEQVPDPWPHLHGWRVPGTGFPYLIMLGTLRYAGVRDFCVVYRRRPAVIVTLRDAEFARLIVTDAVLEWPVQ